MEPIVIRHELDPTGKSPNNFVDEEPHVLLNRNTRAVVPAYGAYYTESLVITDTATGKVLKKGEQYFPAEYQPLPSGMYGKEICTIIIITDKTVSPNVKISYQCVGSYYGTSINAIITQIDNMNLDNRPVRWPDIINKPERFNPAHHWHDAGEVIGFEYLVYAVDRLTSAVELGDAASHDVIYDYIDKIEAAIVAQLGNLNTDFLLHRNNTNNPHNVTAEQINTYAKPQIDSKDKVIRDLLDLHMANKNNPHNVTPTQLDVYVKGETDSKDQAIINSLNNHTGRRDNPHGVTPAQLGVYTMAQVDQLINSGNTALTNALNSHTSRRDNPHDVTAAQLGVYQIATVDQLVNAANQNIANHANRVDNPHGTTAAQVGAYTIAQVNAGFCKAVGDVTLHARHDIGQMYIMVNGGWQEIITAARFNAWWDQRLGQRMSFSY
jgi:hypothetical protein